MRIIFTLQFTFSGFLSSQMYNSKGRHFTFKRHLVTCIADQEGKSEKCSVKSSQLSFLTEQQACKKNVFLLVW